MVVPEEFKEFYLKGGDVFAKHVLKAGSIKPREEVGVFCKGRLVAFGEALLSGKEMIDFSKGVAVRVRDGFQ